MEFPNREENWYIYIFLSYFGNHSLEYKERLKEPPFLIFTRGILGFRRKYERER